MVDIIGRAKVIVEGDVDSRSIDSAGGKIGSALKKGALVGGAALGALAVGAVKTFQAFEEAEAQSRKLTQVLDNMGKSSAGPAVEKLADSISRLTGVDDDLIKQGSTLLATFSNVAASAGETGGTFERATKAAVDMAATGFGSVESASIMLGKALQDPLKGITALGRAGVTFTEEQKKQIEGFVAANDLISAQGIILAEVERQVQGTAEANATETQKIGAAWGELQENLGQIVADIANALTGEGDGSLSGSIRTVSDELDEFANSKSWDTMQGRISTTADLIGRVVGPVETLIGWFNKLEKEMPILADALKFAYDPLTKLTTIIDEVSDAAEAAWTWLKRLDGVSGDDVPDAPDISQPRSTRAVGGPASGLTLVGERGPELVALPTGSYVHTAANTQQMLAGGGDSVVINNQYFGPVTGNEQKRELEWVMRFGLRFGSVTGISPSTVNA